MLVLVFFGLGFIVYRGAPYLPTFQREIDQLFAKLELPKNSVVVDLGSGDGRLLRTAAKYGYRAVGYEINPVLWAVSRWRLRHEARVKVCLQSLWRADLAKADLVFIFGITRIMPELEKKLRAELQPGSYVVCNTFELARTKQLKHLGTLHIYKF